ncbi:MAG: HAMP domain-containing sensor histidine kinase [Lachnospiraceae bacterium]|nr:HAMP domain-containing sensor histidine kinase [Lachnospiraceae bacterium]
MKKKIFFATLVLFTVLLNSMILIVSNVILKDKLFAAREKCLAEHYVIASSLVGDMQALEQRGNSVEDKIDNLMRLYSRYLQGKGSGLAVAFSGDWIYESPAISAQENGIFPPDTGHSQERLVYLKNKSNPVLCVYGSFPAPFQEYGLLYLGDLSGPVRSWRQTKNILFLAGDGVMFVMAFFLSWFLHIIFRPLRQISGTSAEIANGNYGSRIPVRGKDEIAGVASHFNRMAEQVETQIRQLAEAAEQKQQFIDNFSHELRIPLTAIYGYAEYIQKASVSEEEQYESTQFIMSECSRLQHMAYQLLDMALLREKEGKDNECSLKALFSQSEKTMQMRAAKKDIKLSYVLTQDYVVRGNAQQLLMVIDNLIDNAIKASQTEGEVRISAYAEETQIVVKVEDHGIGMEAEQLFHIREAFYRVDKARSRAAGGAGLGLAICEKIMQMHHAGMTFLSEPGKGTVVRLSFPKC